MTTKTIQINVKLLTKKQSGFSIVELMITLVISIAITTGLFSIYLNTRLSQELIQANAKIQESGRFALEYLKRDIRMISYKGCSSNKQKIIKVKASNFPANYNSYEQEIVGFDIKTDWHINTQFEEASTLVVRPKIGTSAFLISRMASIGTPLTQSQLNKTDPLIIDTQSNLNLKQDDIVYISDCFNTDLFSLSAHPITSNNALTLLHSTDTNLVPELSKVYQKNAYIAKYQSYFYFVGDTQRMNKTGDKVYALYQADINYSVSPTRYSVNELIEGVENLQILYGEVLPTNNIKYVKSSDVSDMKNVSSMQLGLLISSSTNVRESDDTNTYYIAQQAINTSGENSHAIDKRLRHAFNSTINIRNRGR